MTFKETFERAARIAEEGWGLAERRHADLRGAVNGLQADADSAATFLENGQAPALYSVIRNPGLAKALRLIQAQGRDAFYKGDIAKAIVAKVKAGGGVMELDDLAEFQSEWVEPISTNYHGYDVFELPPPGQGFAALEMLNIARGLRAEAGDQAHRSRSVRSDELAPAGRGEEARLLGSAGEERRSRSSRTCRWRS